MRAKSLLLKVLCSLALLATTSCEPPNHLDVSASGDAAYFAMSTLPQYHIYQGSRVYRFDVERCRLEVLSGNWAMNTWVTGADDGGLFCYTRCYSASDFALFLKRPGDKEEQRLGAAHKAYAAPVIVPGKSPHILAFTGRALAQLNWTAFDASGREVGLPINDSLKAVGTDTPAIATDRVAVPVYGMIPEYWKTNQKPWAIRVFVVDLSSGTPLSVEAGLIDVYPHETQRSFLDYPTVDLDFSPDGKRLVVSKWDVTDTCFYEFDADGKRPPKLLFTDKNAWKPMWTPDGMGVVYLRKHTDPVKWNRLQVVVWQPTGGAPKAIAEITGQMRGSGVVLRRRDDGKIRAIGFADDGIRVIDVAPDGSGAAEKHITREMLGHQMALAWFTHVFQENRKINQYQAPWEVMQHFYKIKPPEGTPREDTIAAALDTAWKENTAW